MKILSHNNARIGGRNIDKIMIEYVYKKLKEDTADLPELYDDVSLYTKISNAVISAKEKLSAESVQFVKITVESYYEDDDYEMMFNIDEFNELIKINKIDENFHNIVKKTVDEANLNEDKELLNIVIIGGSLRIPLFKNILIHFINEYNSNGQLYQTLNMDESIATGCCYYCAILQGNWIYNYKFNQEDFNIEDKEEIDNEIKKDFKIEEIMQETDNKTTYNISLRNKLLSQKYLLVQIPESNIVDQSLFKECLEYIDEILKTKNNTFEDLYKECMLRYKRDVFDKYIPNNVFYNIILGYE